MSAPETPNEGNLLNFTFHFVFIMLWGLYLWLKQNEITVPKIVRLVIISLCYGILIEILQETCTTTRHADIFDVLANFIGAAAAIVVFILIKKFRQEHKVSKH